VHVQWHDDRIEISNPGGFPEGVRLDNLPVTQLRPRNPLPAGAFKRAGVVDRAHRKRHRHHLLRAAPQRPTGAELRAQQRDTESGRLPRHGTKKGAWYEGRA